MLVEVFARRQCVLHQGLPLYAVCGLQVPPPDLVLPSCYPGPPTVFPAFVGGAPVESLDLRFLNSSAFEPLSEASLRALSQKMLFLLALATAKRVGELQALSSVVSYVGSDACLAYVPQLWPSRSRSPVLSLAPS